MTTAEKLGRLRRSIGELESAIVAYSGGADSAFLADVAHEMLGERSLAVTAVSASLAPEERAAARRVAVERGWRHREVTTNELERDEYVRNAPDRCYHCKTELFEVLSTLVAESSAVVLVGTNLDDRSDFRPGQRAASERGVRAPLLESELTKEEIRALSRERGLPTWNKPASACLSSRIAYGVEVTPERLDRVGKAEAFLRSLGVAEVRVRDHGELARIEVPRAEIARLATDPYRGEIEEHMRGLGFVYVTLDLQGFRSGSMNQVLLSIGRREG